MSSPRRAYDDPDEFDAQIRAALRESLPAAAPSAQVRRNILQIASSRRGAGGSAPSAAYAPSPGWPVPWTLWSIYAVYSDLHRSVIR